jgi:integration host factor subunit beta
MTKSELIEIITREAEASAREGCRARPEADARDHERCARQGERIEIRGFGSFSLHFRPPRQGRNPKTGEAVALSGKYVPHFKPGKDLRDKVNQGTDKPIRD